MTPEEDPYFGDDALRALQAARDVEVPEVRDVPGIVTHGRVFSSDDPDRLGWDRMREVMAREGSVQVRGATPEMIRTAEAELADFAPKLHLWDMFMADAEQVRAACGAIVAEGLPEGVSHQPHGTLSAQDLHEMQAFLDSHGVSPLSKPALAGTLFPARTVVLRGPEGGIVATGFACMTHNAHSWLAGVAWVGLIAVDPAMRGLGLGKTADALANLAAVDELGATGVVEFVATDNAASRAVLSACGLSQVPDRTVVMFTQSATRMTR